MLTASFMLPVSAQQSYTYLFSATPFTSSPAGGPALETIGTTITPVTIMIPATTCPDTPTINLTYFQFNSGFKAKAFFTGSYSIEIIFKFDELNGYNRIIDFSNGLSDYGIYTLSDCLNFYPTGNIGTCPGAFDTTNYKQIVITRNDTTKDMNVYVNGTLFTNHNDAINYYVIGAAPNDSIKFFNDDMVVPNEASPGYVVLIRMADFILSPLDVLTSYNNFCNDITGIQELKNNTDFSIYPNPNNGTFYLSTNKITRPENIKTALFDPAGKLIFEKELNATDCIKIPDAADGIYFLRFTSENYTTMKKFLIVK
jgi:hypothetical protein